MDVAPLDLPAKIACSASLRGETCTGPLRMPLDTKMQIPTLNAIQEKVSMMATCSSCCSLAP